MLIFDFMCLFISSLFFFKKNVAHEHKVKVDDESY